jgi:uncharacterized membrane protein YgdD (TMEM256/DUF423 family)
MHTLYTFSVLFNMFIAMLVLFYLSHADNSACDKNNSILYAFGVQQIHCIALFGLISLIRCSSLPRICVYLAHSASILFCLGMILFSLNIYVKNIFELSVLASFIPFGGAMLFFGWALVLLLPFFWFTVRILGRKF